MVGYHERGINPIYGAFTAPQVDKIFSGYHRCELAKNYQSIFNQFTRLTLQEYIEP
jgi:hypothetical protein